MDSLIATCGDGSGPLREAAPLSVARGKRCPAVVQLPAGKALTVRSGGGRVPRLARQPEHGPQLRDRGRQDRRTARRGPPAGVGRGRRDRRGPGTAVGHRGGQHLERPPGGGAVVAGLVPRARLRRPGGPGLGEAAGGAGLRDPGPLEDGRRPADRPARGPPAGEDAVADALRDRRARGGDPRREHRGPGPRRAPLPGEGEGRPAARPAAAAQAREDFVLETVYWDAGTARLLPRLLQGPHARAGVRHPPPPRAGEGRQPARRVPGHRAGPAVLRAGPRSAGRAHRRARAGDGLGPARVPPLRPDPPRRAGRVAC